MPDNTLDSAIEQAIETHKGELQQTQTTTAQTENTQTEQTTQTETTTGGKEETPVVDIEVEQAKQLVRALKDPEQSAKIIDFLAIQAGYSKQKTVETKQEAAEVKADLTELLRAELGDDLAFMAPKLSKALDKYLEEKIKAIPDNNADLRERFEQRELERVQTETAQVHVAVAQEYFNSDNMPDNVIAEMSKAMDKFPPSKDSVPSDYYRDIFTFVAGKLGLQKQAQRGRTTAERNVADRGVRDLASTNRGTTPNTETIAPRKMSIDEAVRSAVKTIELKKG